MQLYALLQFKFENEIEVYYQTVKKSLILLIFVSIFPKFLLTVTYIHDPVQLIK